MIIDNLNKLNSAISTDIEIFDKRGIRIIPGDIISTIYRKHFVTGIIKTIEEDKSAICLLKDSSVKQGKIYPDRNADGCIIINDLLSNEEKNAYYQLDNKYKNRYKEQIHNDCLSFIYHNKITGECGITMRQITYTGNFKNSDWQKWKLDNESILKIYDLFVCTTKFKGYLILNNDENLFMNINDVHYKQVSHGLWTYHGQHIKLVNQFFPNVVNYSNEKYSINCDINLYFYIPDEPEFQYLKKPVFKYEILKTNNKIGYFILSKNFEPDCFKDYYFYSNFRYNPFTSSNKFKSEWNRIILENGYNKKFLKIIEEIEEND